MSAELEAWREARGVPEVPELVADILPMTGYADDQAALALYLVLRVLEAGEGP